MLGYAKKTAGRVTELALSSSGKATGVVFGSNIIASGLGFISTLIATRLLGPTDFGVLSTVIAVMTIIVGLTDLGLGTTGVRFISDYLRTNTGRAYGYLRVIFRIEILIGLMILLAGVVFTPVIARYLGGDDLTKPIYLAFIGAFGLSVGVFYNIILQSYEKFGLFSILGIVNGATRLLVLLFLYFSGQFLLPYVLLVYALTPLIGLVVGFFIIPKEFISSKDSISAKEVIPELVAFGKWTMVSFIAMSIVGRFDIIALKRYSDLSEVGTYGAAVQLATVLPILIGSITSVLLPKVSRLDTFEQLKGFVKRSLLASSAIFIFLIPIILLIEPTITFLLGDEYYPSVPIFKILFWGFMISLFANPLAVALFRLNRPNIAAFSNILQMVTGLSLYFILVPIYGAHGAAYANFFVSLAGVLVIIPAISILLSGKFGAINQSTVKEN